MADFNLELLKPVLDTYSPQGRTALIPALYAAQNLYGYLPEIVSTQIGRALGVPLAEVYGVIDFYTLLYREPVGKVVVQVCGDPACSMAGSEGVFKMLSRRMKPGRKESGPAGSLTLERAPCLGLCEHAPAMLVQGEAVGELHPHTWQQLVAQRGKLPQTYIGGDVHILTANLDLHRAVDLATYQQRGGYGALQKALDMGAEAVIGEVKASGLVGRGGAAFPTGVKWEGAARAEGQPKYVVCNADEAEPGTFKDRIMMENDPHRVLEGLMISAAAVGAAKGYIYIRGEYNQAAATMTEAVNEAYRAGYLGQHVMGTAFCFEVEMRRGAGAYVCGEETALFESIEGKRGFPRMKPPFPTVRGLFGKPTVINNVETLCNIPTILQGGAAAYRQMGTEKSPGSKLFCLSGDVTLPGLYEIPFGVSFEHLLDLAGGVRGGRQFQAALFGGAAGALASAADLKVNLSFEDLRSAGLALGSGVITVFDETRDLRDILLRLARFFAEESCGKCYPCQLGTQRQVEIIQRLVQGRLLAGDVERLQDVGASMTDASLCGLGQTASSAVLSAIKNWPELFQVKREVRHG